MKKSIFFFLTIAMLFSCKSYDHDNRGDVKGNEKRALNWLEEWLSSWELISKEVFKLPETHPPIMLFYDDNYVYTTSEIATPNGVDFNGPNFFNIELAWKREAHNDTITIPDGKRVPLQLMTFAAPSEKENVESFFVMAAPSFWENVGLDSKEVGLKKMLTGVFLHEFTHTRQMNGIGSKITEFENNYKFKFDVSDDMIQDYFSGDSTYVHLFNKEVDLFYRAATAENKNEAREFARKGMELLTYRQANYLMPEKEILIEMDNIFLTMEGLGQYAMVSWLTHPKGGNVSFATAVKATRRGKESWSQDEGLALILLYERLVSNPDWKIMFTTNSPDIVSLIKKEIDVVAN